MERPLRKGLGLGLASVAALLFVASISTAQEKKPAPAPGAAAPMAKPGAAPAAPAAGAPAAPAAGAGTAPAPMPPPKPAPELDQMKFLLGKWKCEGKELASMMGPEHAIKGSAEAKLDVDNFWQTFTYEEKKTKEHMGLKVHGLWGWNAGIKKFIRAGADNRGGWDSGTSPGFEGDKMLWSGDFTGPMGTMPYHHTFTKKSDKEWSHALEIKTPDGKWTPVEEITCKK